MTVKLTVALVIPLQELSACDEEGLTTIVVRQESGLRSPTRESAADRDSQWNR